MRFTGLALFASAIVLSACGGGDKTNADTTATTTGNDTAATAPTGGQTTAGQPAAITGTTHEVKMLGDEKGYRFEPANITVKQGDGIRFQMVSGGPHNVAFDVDKIPANAKAALAANMPNQMGELSSPMMMNPNESYTISFANVPTGDYPYHCTPHLALGMKGVVTVQ